MDTDQTDMALPNDHKERSESSSNERYSEPLPAAPGSFETLPDRIYCLGFMGSGKSKLGAKLARYMGYDFADLDDRIREAAGQDIPAIFSAEGESGFRKREEDALRGTEKLSRTVIALGGGTPCFADNMDWVNAHGHSVYFRLPVPVLFGRLRRKKAGRPLIARMDDETLRAFIQSKLDEREPWYKQARQTLDVVDMNAAQAAALLLAAGGTQ